MAIVGSSFIESLVLMEDGNRQNNDDLREDELQIVPCISIQETQDNVQIILKSLNIPNPMLARDGDQLHQANCPEKSDSLKDDDPVRILPSISEQDNMQILPCIPSLPTHLPDKQLLSESYEEGASGIIVLTKEERRTLIAEGYPIPTKLPLSQTEQMSLMQIRRRIRNRISAQESRKNKQEYTDALERKCDSSKQMPWRSKVEALETQNSQSSFLNEPVLRICELTNAKILTNNTETYTFPPTQKRKKTVMPLKEDSILYDDPRLPAGWRRSVKKWKEGKYEVTIHSPDFYPHWGTTFKSSKKLKAHLEEFPDLPYTSEDFNFSLTDDPRGCKTTIKRKLFRRKLSSSGFDRKFPKRQNIVNKPPVPSLSSHTETQFGSKEEKQLAKDTASTFQILVNQSNSQIQKIVLPPILESTPEAQTILKNYQQNISNIAISPAMFETNNTNQVILPKFVLKSSINRQKLEQKYRKESEKQKTKQKLSKEKNEDNEMMHDESIDYDEPILKICELTNAKILTNNTETYTSPPTQKRRKTMAETTTTSATFGPRIVSICGSVDDKTNNNPILKLQPSSSQVQVPGLMDLSSAAQTTLTSIMSPSKMSSSIQKSLNLSKTIEIALNMTEMQDDIIVIRPGDQMLSHEDIALFEEDAHNDGTAQDMRHYDHKRKVETKLKSKKKHFDIKQFAINQVRKVIFGTSDPSQLPFLASNRPVLKQSTWPWNNHTKNDNVDKNTENINTNNENFDTNNEILVNIPEKLDTNIEMLNNNSEHMAKINENVAINEENLDTDQDTLENSSGSVSENTQEQADSSVESNDSEENAQEMPKNITHRQIRDMLFSSDSEPDSDTDL